MEEHRILLVDDDPLILQTIGSSLESEGYKVTTAESGNDAISLLSEETFGLVITDLVMEPVDGIGVLKKSKEINPESMVILLTGFGNMTSAVDAIRLDADDYLLKPCEPEDLFFRVKRCFEELGLKKKIRMTEKRILKNRETEIIGNLSGGVAHDFNNLLASIMGLIELSMNKLQPGTESADFLSDAMKSCIQARELAKKFVTLSQSGAPKRETGVISVSIRQFTCIALSGTNVKCEERIHEDLWAADFDEGQIGQVLSCIVTNAKEAMPDGGTITVEADNVIIGDESDISVDGGQYVKISIKDHGRGIIAENLDRIFDPYFSTKESFGDRGMGLGLATALSIIKKHEGDIRVESELGVGTTVFIYIPATEKESVVLQSDKEPILKEPAVGKKKILVMDDEEGLRFCVKGLLDLLGHNAECFKDGAEAIEAYKKAKETGEPFDAVVLDLTVQGGMGGKETIQKLLEIDPDVKGIVASGYSNDPIIDRFKEYGFCEALPKPYLMGELGKAIENVFQPGKGEEMIT